MPRTAVLTAAAAAGEVALRLAADHELLESRVDALSYAAANTLMGAAAGAAGGIPSALFLAPRCGVLASSFWPAATVAVAFPLANALTGPLGRVPAGWVALLVGMAAATALVLLPGRGRAVRGGPGRAPVRSWAVVSAVIVITGVHGWLAARAWTGKILPPAGAPSLVIVTVDTLRADALGAFRGARELPRGLERAITPSLDRLAGRSFAFTEASTPLPKTPQAVSSLMTGLYPASHGVRDLFSLLDASHSTLAEVLREEGWRTGAVVTNMLIGHGSGLGQGFDRFHDKDGLRPFVKRLALVNLGLKLWPRAGVWALNRFPYLLIGKETAVETTDRAISMLQVLAGHPFFLWVHYLDPHWTYQPPQPIRDAVDPRPGEHVAIYEDVREGRVKIGDMIHHNSMTPDELERLRALYAGEVRYIDREVDRLLEAVAESAGAKGAVVVFTADHGESLGEHSYYFSHGDLVYEPTMRVPLIISLPGVEQGREISVPVSLVDLFPTLLRILDVEPPDSVQGRNLAHLMSNHEPSPEALTAPVFGESDLSYLEQNPHLTIPGEAGKMRFIRSGTFKLVKTPRDHEKARRISPALGEGRERLAAWGFEEKTRLGESGADLVELYDLASDPGETTDISEAAPDLATAMLNELDKWTIATMARRSKRLGVSRDLLETMRTLGYLDSGGAAH